MNNNQIKELPLPIRNHFREIGDFGFACHTEVEVCDIVFVRPNVELRRLHGFSRRSANCLVGRQRLSHGEQLLHSTRIPLCLDNPVDMSSGR